MWAAWLGFSAWLFASLFVWHLNEVAAHSPAPLQPYLPLIAGALLAGLGGYLVIRRRGVWRYELLAMMGLPVAMALVRAPLALLSVMLIGIGAFAVGDAVLDKLRMLPERASERLALSAGAGLVLQIFVLFWLGMTGLYLPWVAWALALTPILLFRRRLVDLFRVIARMHGGWAASTELKHLLAGIVVAFTLAFTFVGAVMAIAPSTAFDPVKMHLSEALFFLQQNGLKPMPMLQDSYYPQGFEVLMTWAWLLGGQTAAQLVSPMFYALMSLAMYCLLRRAGASVLASGAGAALGASLPFLHWTGWVPKNDLALASFQMLMLVCLLTWADRRDWRWLPLAAVFLASSFSIKHTALFGALGAVPLFLYALWTEKRRARAFAFVGMLFVVFGLYWHARTFVLKGNPIYPMSFSRAEGRDQQGHPTHQPGPRDWKPIRAVWQLHFEGGWAFESPSKTPLGICFVLFAPAWLIGWRKWNRRAIVLLLVFSVSAYWYWSSILLKARYGIPFLALIVALTVTQAVGSGMEWRRWGRGLLCFGVAASLVYAGLVILMIEMTAPRLLYFAGLASRDGVLESALPSYNALQKVRSWAVPGDVVATFDDCASAYAPDPCRSLCCVPQQHERARGRAAQDLLDVAPRFVILPNNAEGVRVGREMESQVSLRERYRDDAYTVYEAKRLNAGAE